MRDDEISEGVTDIGRRIQFDDMGCASVIEGSLALERVHLDRAAVMLMVKKAVGIGAREVFESFFPRGGGEGVDARWGGGSLAGNEDGGGAEEASELVVDWGLDVDGHVGGIGVDKGNVDGQGMAIHAVADPHLVVIDARVCEELCPFLPELHDFHQKGNVLPTKLLERAIDVQ